MLLRRVTITGFKSFAAKTVIEFEHGITAVVGPNGSGKSNLADAIRWALGEQGKARLRLGDREEVVFAGNAARAKSSFAEVILLFDNEDGSFPLDLTEVEISRRMYRSGETDYRLAGRSVRLADIQALLAQAGVGAGSYAVIGQGMIDSMLMSSPAERKLLFEEAAGIRGPELGREAAMRKLTATATNLTRLRDISAELAPRLGSLQTAVAAADERAALAARVEQLRGEVVAAEFAAACHAQAAARTHLAELADTAHRLRHERIGLTRAATRRERAEAAATARRQALQADIAGLEQARDEAATAVATVAAATADAERRADAAAELTTRLGALTVEQAAAATRLADLRAEVATNTAAAARAAKAVDRTARDVATAQAALVAIRDGATGTARDEYLDHALSILKSLARSLSTDRYDTTEIRLLVHKAGRLLSHATRSGAAELLGQLKTAQKHLEAAMTRRETAIEHQTNIAITGRSLEIDLAHHEAEAGRLAARRAELQADLDALEASAGDVQQSRHAATAAQAALEAATARLDQARGALAALTAPADPVATADVAGLARVTAALDGLASEQAAARASLAAATSALAAAQHKAAEWRIILPSKSEIRRGEPAAKSPDLPALTDALARAETLLQARNEQYEQQLGEYQEVTQRQTELAAQIADLETAEADLTKLIGELDSLIRTRFKENFQALAAQFSDYFGRLFEGGNASLELTEAADPTRPEGAGYGITIKASPKGKRLASIAALSGGERALAGVALVAAIMRVNPSPFVVLDEIDAALDEANSGRLAGILSELQQYSQLIVITHNRQTMKAARVLFGVTMNDQHISHLISMRLEQATQMAAR